MSTTSSAYNYREKPYSHIRSYAIHQLSDLGLNEYLSSVSNTKTFNHENIKGDTTSINTSNSKGSEYIKISDEIEIIERKNKQGEQRSALRDEVQRSPVILTKLTTKKSRGASATRLTAPIANREGISIVSKRIDLTPQLPRKCEILSSEEKIKLQSINKLALENVVNKLSIPKNVTNAFTRTSIRSDTSSTCSLIRSVSSESFSQKENKISPDYTRKLPHIECISSTTKFMGTGYDPYNFQVKTGKNWTKRNIFGTLFVH